MIAGFPCIFRQQDHFLINLVSGSQYVRYLLGMLLPVNHNPMLTRLVVGGLHRLGQEW
jgi:hypothetical protein